MVMFHDLPIKHGDYLPISIDLPIKNGIKWHKMVIFHVFLCKPLPGRVSFHTFQPSRSLPPPLPAPLREVQWHICGQEVMD